MVYMIELCTGYGQARAFNPMFYPSEELHGL